MPSWWVQASPVSVAHGSSRAAAVVLALPAERTRDLLGPLVGAAPDFAAAHALLQMNVTRPALTVAACYEDAGPELEWDVYYPDDSTVLRAAVHDSAKRRRRS